MKVYDTIIVGAGISGLYLNYKLKSKKNVIILEANNIAGGRIQSLKDRFTNIEYIIESGANRISSNHHLMLKLIKQLNLSQNLIESYNTKSQLFNILINYAKKQSQKKLINNTLKSLIDEIPNIKLQDLYKEFGYNSIIETMNACDALKYVEQSYHKKFFIMENGLSSIIKKMKNYANIKYDTIMSNLFYKNNLFLLETNRGNLVCKKLVLAIPKEQLIKIPYLKNIKFSKSNKNYNLNNLVSENDYIRIYMSFSKKDKKYWYQNHLDDVVISNGLIRQLIPISLENGIIEIYCNMTSAKFWQNSSSRGTIKQDLKNELQKLFPRLDVVEPDKVYAYYWKSGTHFWKKGIDSNYFYEKVMQPMSHKNINNLFIIGESYSLCQAWMEGALQTVEDVIPKLYNIENTKPDNKTIKSLKLKKFKIQKTKKTKKKYDTWLEYAFDKLKNIFDSDTNHEEQKKESNENTYTIEDVAKHNTKNDAWLVYKGGVYDVTKWIDRHPGGMIIMKGVGKDATQLFEFYNHSDHARKRIEDFRIGYLR